MKATIVPRPQTFNLAQLKEMDTPALRQELANALGMSANSLVYLAAIWTELEKRGEDLSDLRQGWWAYIPAIAAGTVLPETVAKFAGRPTLLRAISLLPPNEQRAIVDGKSIEFAVREGDQYTHRMLPIHALSPTQSRQVFDERNRTIRTVAEQIAILTGAPRPAAKMYKAPKRGSLRANREKNMVMLGRKPLNPADLIAALGDLRSPETASEEDAEKPIVAKLTEAEHAKLSHAAVDGKTTIGQLIRNALRAVGQI